MRVLHIRQLMRWITIASPRLQSLLLALYKVHYLRAGIVLVRWTPIEGMTQHCRSHDPVYTTLASRGRQVYQAGATGLAARMFCLVPRTKRDGGHSSLAPKDQERTALRHHPSQSMELDDLSEVLTYPTERNSYEIEKSRPLTSPNIHPDSLSLTSLGALFWPVYPKRR